MKKYLVGILAATTIVAVTAGCHTQVLQVPTGPGTAYPCGVDGVPCITGQGDALYYSGMCCWQGEVCGGAFPNVGCPDGQCCDVDEQGGDSYSASREPKFSNVRVVHPQWAAK